MLSYLVAMATFGTIYALLALGLNVMWGMAGMVNLGVVGFYAVGAYASALVTVNLGLPVALGLVVAMAVTAAAGVVTCLGLTRLRDDYFAVVTLGFAEVIRIVASNETWLTRGSDGISGIPQPLKAVLGADFNLAYLGLCLAILAVVLALLERLRTSPFGRVLRAIREDPTVAAVAGKNVLMFKIKAFALGGIVAGLAGALYGHYTSYIVPDIFEPIVTIYIFLALTAGGRGNNWGAVLGAFLVVFVLESTRFAAAVLPAIGPVQLAAVREMLIGLLLLVVLRVRPEGLLPEPRARLGAGKVPAPAP
ncbi:MAG: branched-chain amino acid ABC transporter permease [Alphaproteobacteria bacterium]